MNGWHLHVVCADGDGWGPGYLLDRLTRELYGWATASSGWRDREGLHAVVSGPTRLADERIAAARAVLEEDGPPRGVRILSVSMSDRLPAAASTF